MADEPWAWQLFVNQALHGGRGIAPPSDPGVRSWPFSVPRQGGERDLAYELRIPLDVPAVGGALRFG